MCPKLNDIFSGDISALNVVVGISKLKLKWKWMFKHGETSWWTQNVIKVSIFWRMSLTFVHVYRNIFSYYTSCSWQWAYIFVCYLWCQLWNCRHNFCTRFVFIIMFIVTCVWFVLFYYFRSVIRIVQCCYKLNILYVCSWASHINKLGSKTLSLPLVYYCSPCSNPNPWYLAPVQTMTVFTRRQSAYFEF